MPEIPKRTADHAANIQATYNRDVANIRNNGDLTEDAKIRRLAIEYTRRKQEIDTLREAWQESSDAAASSIDRDVFGASNVTGVDAISIRDAADRASRLTEPGEGMRLLEQAERTGDQVLARAVAQFAYDQRSPLDFFGGQGWPEVVDAYASRRPDVAGKLESLAANRRGDINSVATAMFTFALHKPTELDRYSDYRLRIMAETAA